MDYFSSKTMDGVINSNGLPSPTKRTQREYKGSIFFWSYTWRLVVCWAGQHGQSRGETFCRRACTWLFWFWLWDLLDYSRWVKCVNISILNCRTCLPRHFNTLRLSNWSYMYKLTYFPIVICILGVHRSPSLGGIMDSLFYLSIFSFKTWLAI